jgi:hypothetical protein
MSVHYRRLFIAGCAALCLGSAAIGQEQDQQQAPSDSGVVGPPQLREFQLPGQRTTPPADTPPAPVDITPPPPKIDVPPPTTTPQPQPSTGRTTPAVRNSETPPERPTETQAPPRAEPQPSASPSPPSPVAAAPQQAPAAAPPQPTRQPEAAPAPPSAPSGGTFPWLLLLIGIGGVAAAAFAFLKLRPARDRYEAETYAEPERAVEPRPEPVRDQDGPAVLVRRQPPSPTQAAPVAAPPTAPKPRPQPQPQAQAPAAQAAAGSIVGVQARPWLNLEFVPAQAAATATEAVVQYELLLKNVGNTLARNIRVEARMFNAGADQDQAIADFFRRPLDERRSARILAIPARSAARMRNAVAMPNEELREINVQGRRLFIPMVAINVIYEWGEGKVGQTSMSYLVGREAETPTEKMGAFRLDLGPRVYRSVGQRPNNVAVLV